MDFDNIGDFLYLILLAVFSIFGFFGKKKKVNQTQKSPSKSFFETIMSMGEEQPQTPVNESADISINDKEEEIVYTKAETFTTLGKSTIKPSSYLSDLVSDDGFKTSPNKDVGDDVIKNGEIGSNSEGIIPNLSNPTDLKRGIVFSELIKPKYIDM